MNKRIRYYTGVGSRKTPGPICALMSLLGFYLELEGWRLRSGGAPGADKAFAALVKYEKDIYVPWNGFDGLPLVYPVTDVAMEIAGVLHPYWSQCSGAAKLLHGRNSYQVLGHSLDVLSEFLVCWTPDACKTHAARSKATGGTGTAISIANVHGVPVFNLADPADLEKIKNYINTCKVKYAHLKNPLI